MGRTPINATDRGLGILAAWLGAVLGAVVLSSTALLAVRAAGVDEGLADYGLPYQLLLGGVCVGAALGCYLALRATGQALALPASVILLMLVAAPGLLAATRAGSASGWPSTWEWAVKLLFYVALPLASPVIAFLLAEALARRGATN